MKDAQRKRIHDRFGSSFDHMLNDSIVTIGGRQWSRHDLVSLAEIGHFAAARKLERALDKLDQPTDTPSRLARVDPHALAVMKGVGETTVYTLLCLQAALDVDQMSWEATWRTQKHRAAKANGKVKAST